MKQFNEDKIQLNEGFWRVLEKLGASRQAIAQCTALPIAVMTNKVAPTTAQFFAIWEALPVITQNDNIGFDFVKHLQVTQLPPELFSASLAKDYGSSLARLSRFKRLSAPEIISITRCGALVEVSIEWIKHDTMPDTLVDTTMSFILALGNDNAIGGIEIDHIELQRAGSKVDLEAVFDAKVTFGCERNVIVLKASSLEAQFATYNQALSDMLLPQLESTLHEQSQSQTTSSQVKWVIEQFLSAGSPAIADVAKELGVSVRTLQRRITTEGNTFKGLLNIVRLEMAKQYLMEEGMSLNEIAVLLGYEDQNSFFRAFKQLQGDTPSNWRESHAR